MFIDGDNNQCGSYQYFGGLVNSPTLGQGPTFTCYKCIGQEIRTRDSSTIERITRKCTGGWTKNPPPSCKCYKCEKGKLKTRNRRMFPPESPSCSGAGWENDISKVGLNGDCGTPAMPFKCYKCKTDQSGGITERFKIFGSCKSNELKGAKPTMCDTA